MDLDPNNPVLFALAAACAAGLFEFCTPPRSIHAVRMMIAVNFYFYFILLAPSNMVPLAVYGVCYGCFWIFRRFRVSRHALPDGNFRVEILAACAVLCVLLVFDHEADFYSRVCFFMALLAAFSALPWMRRPVILASAVLSLSALTGALGALYGAAGWLLLAGVIWSVTVLSVHTQPLRTRFALLGALVLVGWIGSDELLVAWFTLMPLLIFRVWRVECMNHFDLVWTRGAQ